MRGDGGRRRLRLDASRARPHARARHAPERADGGALREDRGLLARLRRLDAPLRRRARQPRRERGRRRRAPVARRRGPRVQAARRAARRGRVLRRRRHQHRHLPRVAQPRPALEDEDALRLREQRLGRVDAGLAALARLGGHVEARARLRHALDQGRRAGRRGGLREGRARRSSTSAPARGPVFLDVETYRMHGHYIGDPQVYRSKEDRDRGGRARPDRAAAREARGLRTRTGRRSRPRCTGIVEAAVEFAKAGTDPQPEDALKNIYA